MSRLDYFRIGNLPARLTDDKLAAVVQFLRDNGNVSICEACKSCALHGIDDFEDPVCLGIHCKVKGESIVNFIIETHVGLAIHIAGKFKHRHKKDIVAVSLLSLTEAVNKYTKLHDNNISAYATSCIVYGIRRYLKHTPMIRVPNDTYLKTKQTFKINYQAGVIGKRSKVHLQLEVRNILATVAKTKYKRRIAKYMLKGGYKKQEMAQLCGISKARVSQIIQEIEEDFKELWRK